MILSIFLGIFCGVLGTILQDATFGVSYLSQNTSELTFIDNNDVKSLIDTCLNGNGSISELSSLGLSDISFKNEIVDNIYNLENNISQAKNNLSSYEMISIKEVGKVYNNIESNPKNYSVQLNIALNNIRKYIDSSIENSFVSESTPINDAWEIQESDCPKNYKYLSNKAKLRNLKEENGKFCLLIQEWSNEEIKERYKNIQPKDEENPLQNEIENYFSSITLFLADNKELIKSIINKNEEFKKDFKNITNGEISILDDIQNIIKPFRETFEEIVGEDSIFKMLTCGFIKRDINKVLKEMYESLGDDLKSLSSLFAFITFIEFILTFYILIIMSRFEDKKTEDEEEEEDNSSRKESIAVEMSQNSINSECVEA